MTRPLQNNFFKERRENLGLSVQQVSIGTNYDVKTIDNIEKGKVSLSIICINALNNYYDQEESRSLSEVIELDKEINSTAQAKTIPRYKNGIKEHIAIIHEALYQIRKNEHKIDEELRKIYKKLEDI